MEVNELVPTEDAGGNLDMSKGHCAKHPDRASATMERLLALPVRVVHAGHDPIFDRARLHELCRAYLTQRDGAVY